MYIYNSSKHYKMQIVWVNINFFFFRNVHILIYANNVDYLYVYMTQHLAIEKWSMRQFFFLMVQSMLTLNSFRMYIFNLLRLVSYLFLCTYLLVSISIFNLSRSWHLLLPETVFFCFQIGWTKSLPRLKFIVQLYYCSHLIYVNKDFHLFYFKK